jgi:predicted nucleotide-binding protein
MEEEYIEELGVFISHGGESNEWKDLAIFIQSNYDDIKPYELSHQSSRGKNVMDKLSETICEYCDYAIIVVTAEDETKGGQLRARQNVVHELGYCQGVLGRHNVLILKEKDVELFSNVHGIVYESFERGNIKSTFAAVRAHLDDVLQEWEDEELEFGDCEDEEE